MAKHHFLAWLGGADAKLLADDDVAIQTGERTRFAAMGGVLLTTASVATLSMFFALHHGVGVGVGGSIPLALAWGVAILTIDRVLINTMGSARGHPGRLIVTILARLVLAALIAIVVATPLVLQIFDRDINAQIPVLQQQQSATFNRSLANSTDGKQLAKLGSEITIEQNKINGDQSVVDSLMTEAANARSTDSTSYQKYQCESGGLKGSLCPPGTSGEFGNGPLAKGDYVAYLNDVANYNNINNQLTAAKNTLTNDNDALASLKKAQATEQTTINGQITKDDTANKDDTGLLEQIHALFAASAADSSLAWAHWIVTALFFVIEILPVTVKALLLLGSETAYEQIVAKRSEAAIAQAAVTLRAEMDVVQTRAQSMRVIADLQAQNERGIADAKLQTDLAIAQGEEQARKDVKADLIRREKGTRIEANKRFAAATRDYILEAVDDWARMIRDKIRRGAQQQSPNGQVPNTQVQRTAGYTTPGGGNP